MPLPDGLEVENKDKVCLLFHNKVAAEGKGACQWVGGLGVRGGKSNLTLRRTLSSLVPKLTAA